MNCGLCAEFCPFDAIKMDHDFEMAMYDRLEGNIFDKEKLSTKTTFWKWLNLTSPVLIIIISGILFIVIRRKKYAKCTKKDE